MRETRGENPAMAYTFVGRFVDSDERVSTPGGWATAGECCAPPMPRRLRADAHGINFAQRGEERLRFCNRGELLL